MSFFPVTEEVLAVGAIQSGSKERKAIAERSKHWRCPDCQKTNQEIADEFMLPLTEEAAEAELRRAGDDPLAAQLNFESEAQKQKRAEAAKAGQAVEESKVAAAT